MKLENLAERNTMISMSLCLCTRKYQEHTSQPVNARNISAPLVYDVQRWKQGAVVQIHDTAWYSRGTCEHGQHDEKQ